VNRTKLSDWLLRVAFETEDFPFGLKPVVERSALSIATLGMKFIGPLSDADLDIVAGRNRLTVNRLLLRNRNRWFLLLDRSGGLPLARFFPGLWWHGASAPFSLRRGVIGNCPRYCMSARTLRRQVDLSGSAHAVKHTIHLIPGQVGAFEHDFFERTAGKTHDDL
jgi:hypothetical protein